MRIAYVCILLMPYDINGGVGNKIRTQIDKWVDEKNEVKLFFIGSSDSVIESDLSFRVPEKDSLKLIQPISNYFFRIKALIKLINAVDKFSPDLIYFRQSIYIFPLHKLFKIAPVIMELNTIYAEEIRNRSIAHLILYYLTNSWILKKASGFIAISREIAQHPSLKKISQSLSFLF